MSEQLAPAMSPEERVFGNAFSFESGRSNRETVEAFFRERIDGVHAGDQVWLPRILGAGRGAAADLYRNRQLIATLHFDYDIMQAAVYTTSEGGVYGDTVLCDLVTFDEAVETAEQFGI